MDDFVAIDFETANYVRSSVCSIGLVFVRNGQIVDERYSLIKPYPNYYLASNTAIHGLTREDTQDAPVPLYLRNAPTKLMEELGYSDGYRYAHDYPGHWTDLEFMPERLKGTKFYEPADNRREEETGERLSRMWPKYGYGK